MTNAMEALYREWTENCKDSPENIKVFDVLCKENDKTENNKKYDILGEVLNDESRRAFTVGFNTAVQLLM